ncbi:hypothetical protein A9259_16785 [Vibrio cyclitrophicus]|uniref:alpha-1,2-fucosyltransferase n=1 Tax=Vibrio cyclitrophicus TaxID=47951 RepID=UPI0007EEBAE3|nr:alpha-1,2-fucosyltransferase [Vibrio cyclitrophicus]OBS93547.1 hypothetical protein A9259_16785 [Vibrio cyclitrophicus]
MIKVRLYGGLGNQIFQLGISIYIAKILKRKITICNFTNGYKTQRKNQLSTLFDLDQLNVSVSDESDILHRIRLGKMLSLNYSKLTTVNDKNISNYLNNRLSSIKGDVVYLDGYFQSCFNQNIFDSVVESLSSALLVGGRGALDENVATIHIRGGDFLSSKVHFSLGREYYESGIQSLSRYVDRFIIVTDDKEYASKVVCDLNFPPNSHIEISQSLSALNDFELIMDSKYSILSNSTFSIWAGALSTKIATFAPARLSININKNFKFKNEIFWSEK